MRLLLVFLTFSLFTASAQDTFYISASGNDTNNGTSPSSPWKTVPYVQSGKTYLFNKGDTLYFSIGSAANTDPSKKIRISSYGSGAKPVLSLYKKIKAAAWAQYSANVWKVNIGSAGSYTGFNSPNTNVGFIKVNGVIYGNKRSGSAALSSAWDFYSDDTYLYVFSTTRPGAIQASCNVSAIDVSDNMEISDIAICGSGAHALSAHERSNVTLSRIDITEIGGSYLPGYGDGTTRYGNGIEFYNNASNCLIENCSVSQVYDVAFTMQGTGKFANVTFQNNTADKNDQTFETWLGSGSEGFRNCKFINNQCSNAGFGWSHAVRPNKDIGVHILTYLWQVNDAGSQDLLISGNTFTKAKSGLWYWGVWDAAPPATSKNNIVTLDADTPIRSLVSTYTVKNSKDFVSATGLEAGTIFNGTKSDQIIKFEQVTTKTFGDAPFSVLANASSNLAVRLSVLSGPALISGTTLTLKGPGTVVLQAAQDGNIYYNAAAPVTQNFAVLPASTTSPAQGSGSITMEQWLNVSGTDIANIPLSSSPTTTAQLSAFQIPSNTGDNYGTRIRGYLIPSVSGNYIFSVAGDDKAQLWLSTDENPSAKVLIAYTDQWTNPGEYNKYASQKSAAMALTAGKKYYIEALQKEGPGGDNLSVQWQLPGGAVESPLPGKYLSPFTSTDSGTQPVTGNPTATGSIVLETWMNVSGTSISEIPLDKTPTSVSTLTSFEAPSNFADNYGSRIRGYVVPPKSGNYTFWIAGDDKAELSLSTDENPSGKVKIAYTNEWTNVREYNKLASQKSVSITLTAGKRYYIEALQKEGPGGDNLSVQWQLPDGTIQTPLPAQYLAPYSTSQLRTALDSPDLAISAKPTPSMEFPVEANGTSLVVFPNPATDFAQITFSSQENGAVQLRLYSLKGEFLQTIFSGSNIGGSSTVCTLKTQSLSAGTYVVQMLSGKTVLSKKVIVLK